jgi:uncharacterized protein (TIGR02466 family)
MSIADLKGAQLTEVFPVPILQFYWDDSEWLNTELKELILVKEIQAEGISTTNVGGWHSQKDLHRWEGECVSILMSRILEMNQEFTRRVFNSSDKPLIDGWAVEAWANVNRRKDFNKYHHHIRNANLWSGVYYVDLGLKDEDHEQKAKIVFADRHRPEPLNHSECKLRFTIEPRAGLMLFFPSSLGHRVEPHQGSAARITIAFNLKNPGFTTINYQIVANSLSEKTGSEHHKY